MRRRSSVQVGVGGAAAVSVSGRRPPGFLPVLRGVLMVGLGRVVSARAAAAAECWAFLMLVPSASHCWSPSVSLTEKILKDETGGGGTREGGAVILGCRQKKRKAYCREFRQSDWITLE